MKHKLFATFFFSLLMFFSCSSSSPGVELAESSFDFGIVYVNDSASHDFVIENGTGDKVSILEAKIVGTSEFQITAGGKGSAILPKSSLNISVSFEPIDAGFEEATLFVSHTQSNEVLEISLKALGDTKPEFDVDQTTVDFGKLRKSFSNTKDITVTNTGTDKLKLKSLSISGTDSAEFTVTVGGNTPLEIDPQNTHTITIKWASEDPVGAKSASLDIEHDADGSPHSVTLTAETLVTPPLIFITTSLSDAGYLHPYDETIVTSGGTGKNTFSIISGNLPTGLSLDSHTGKITGKGTKVEKCDFELEVDDGYTKISQMFSIEVKIVTGWIDVTPSGVTLSGKECITSFQNKLYFMGGSSYTYDIRIFDPAANTWTTSSTKLAYDHSLGNACVYNNYIYIIAGTNSSTVERYDPVANTITTDTPIPTNKFTDFAVGVYNNEIYCISGYDGGSSPFVEVYKFTPGPLGTNGIWTQLPNAQTSGFGPAMTVYNNQIVVFGGIDLSANDIVRTYDPSTGAEQVLGHLYTATSRFAWGRIGDVLYIGAAGKTTFHKYDLVTNTATKLSDSPVTTTYYASSYTECNGRIYVTDNSADKIYAYIP